MKRLLLAVALCVVASSAAFAQKKTVKEAQSIAKGDKADFAEARTLIKQALENSETKNSAETWFVAGFIEDQQFSAERTKQILGQQPNEPVMYDALIAVLPYFKKAYELDQLPNEKGKVKPKYEKDIKGILSADHVYYFNGGAYYFDQKDYKKAYEFFNQYMEIAEMPMFAGTKTAEKDSTFLTVQFYAAVAATQMNDYPVAIKALTRAKDSDFKQNDVYQYLAYEYQQAGDTVNYVKTMEEGLSKFPDENYFLMGLIDSYIRTNQNDKAVQHLTTAISKNPNNGQLYYVMGVVYETGLKDFDSAETYFKKALEFNPESPESLSSLGRIYYNEGVTKQGEANMINDSKKYQEEIAVAKDLFKKALPYFQKAHELKADEMEYMIALRGIYYNLNMGPELEAIEAEMNK
jgi:tetratricopeptide (TPR) repeat protein